MPLTMHNYVFVSEKTAFYEKFDGVFMLLKNAVIEQVYALWDCIDNRWFDDAPMLIQTSAGILSVNVRSEKYIAIGWNDIPLSEKPVWFDEIEIETKKGLNWIEDLEWRADDKVSQILNEQIDSILFHHEDIEWGVGIGLKMRTGKCLWIYDAGDVISAKVERSVNHG